ncbi:MAG: CGNR zinc finger domain-containing protein [Alphaproteobacteria bacterium]
MAAVIFPAQTAHMASAKFLAGEACLDFVNTLSGRGVAGARDRLVDYADLLAWAFRAGMLDEARAGRLSRRAVAKPEKAARAVERGREMREAMHNVFAAVARGGMPSPEALASFNAALGRAGKRATLAPASTGFAWRWEHDALESPLWAIAHEGAEVLTGAELGRLKECGGHACGWLFIDRSKNGSRRWCEMEICGNRAKARRFLAKRAAGGNDEAEKS